MNKDLVTNTYRIFVVALLVYIAVLLGGIRHDGELYAPGSIQNVRIVNPERATGIQNVSIVGTVPVTGEVRINGGLNGVPVHITNDGGILGEPIPVKIITTDGFLERPIPVKVSR